jgi:histidyl-tRNA synthetase
MVKKTDSGRVEKLFAVKGMNDILPLDAARWEAFEEEVRTHMALYAYRGIRTPVVEPTALFVRGTGETTDIVEKEMYSFEDKLNGEALTLRPENTPGVVRAAIEHNLTYEGGKRLYYMGPMFRHERPQRGRYRQFYQLGAEVLGFGGPEVDVELILLAHYLFEKLGLKDIRIEINSLGVASERLAHRYELIKYFEENAEVLDDDARRRLHANPLRILDTKNPAMLALVSQAPQLLSFLGAHSQAHFDSVKKLLSACGVPWSINPRLVRGLDYYSHTVFEFVTDQLGAQGTLCGGGRYDGLFELLGGTPTPAVGWGMGIERVLELLREQGKCTALQTPDAYAIVPSDDAFAAAICCVQALRNAGVSVQLHASTPAGLGSMKSQFRKADASGASFALIFGADERGLGQVMVKSLRDGIGEQRPLPIADCAKWASTLQSRT